MGFDYPLYNMSPYIHFFTKLNPIIPGISLFLFSIICITPVLYFINYQKHVVYTKFDTLQKVAQASNLTIDQVKEACLLIPDRCKDIKDYNYSEERSKIRTYKRQ